MWIYYVKGVAFVVILQLNHLQRTSIEVTAGVDEKKLPTCTCQEIQPNPRDHRAAFP